MIAILILNNFIFVLDKDWFLLFLFHFCFRICSLILSANKFIAYIFLFVFVL